MEKLIINLDGDNILAGFPAEKVVHTKTFTVTSLSGGMSSGAPSVAIILDLPDGRKVLAETSLRLFLSAARALRAKYGVQFSWVDEMFPEDGL